MPRPLLVLLASLIACASAGAADGWSSSSWGWSSDAWAWRGGSSRSFDDGWSRGSPGWSVRRDWDRDSGSRRRHGRRDADGWTDDEVAAPLDPPTRTARTPGHWERGADDERVWIPDAATTEPADLVTRGIRTRETDAPSRDAPSQTDIDAAVEARDQAALDRRIERRAPRAIVSAPSSGALGGSSAGGAADVPPAVR